MRFVRQNRIMEIIRDNDVENQNQLVDILEKEGFNVTQATVSRDIKELELVKVKGENGKLKYAVRQGYGKEISDKYSFILHNTVVSYQSAENIVVVKTLSGCGNSAAEAIDMLDINHIVGSVAGDNTIMIVVDSKENTKFVLDYLDKTLMKSE
ncbi:MAG: arginine repressor [Clostridia bacterium]|nr:arginine repressor [Clostridia bacterium]